MQIVVSIEDRHGRGFVASSPLAPNVTAEAPTVEDAVAQLQRELFRLAESGSLLQIEVPLPNALEKPKLSNWAAIAGIYKNEPMFDEVIEHMKAYRELRNAEMDEVSE